MNFNHDHRYLEAHQEQAGDVPLPSGSDVWYTLKNRIAPVVVAIVIVGYFLSQFAR